MARSALRIAIGGFTGFIVAGVAYVSVAMLIGNLTYDGEHELGHTPWPVLVFGCLSWLGLLVALVIGTILGIRFGRAYPK